MSETSLVEAGLHDAKQLMQAGKFVEAENHLLTLLVNAPKQGDALYMMAVCLRYQKKYPEALEILRKLRLLVPDHSRAYQEIGHVYRAMNQVDAALNAYSQATLINPALEASFRSQIDILRIIGRSDLAARLADLERQLKELQAMPPPLVAVTDLISQGKLVKAEKLCKAFMQKNPRHIEGMRLLADIGVRLGVLEDAEFLLESAVEFSPQSTKARMDYIQVLRKQQKYNEALSHAKILIQQDPKNPQFQSVFAVESMQSGDYDTALATFDSILDKNPYNFSTHTSKGHAQKTLGKTDQAINSYQSAYKIKPDHGESFFSLANLKTYSFTSDELNSMREQVKRVDLSLRDKAYFHFALAQGCESIGEFDEAFFHLETGNKIKNDQSKYSIERMDAELQAQIDVCDEDFFQDLGAGGHLTKDPIFILGLPRAGSTLIEQILASHSMIDGTLELPNILSIAQSLRGGDIYGKLGNYPKSLKTLTLEQREAFGKSFIEDTRIHRKDAPMFTDKMPNNFRHIGLIHLMMPNAKIIDARRYPLDCCFSMFKQLFAQGQEFSYGLAEAGSYYNSYIKLMDHWDKVLPNKILRVNNEDVIDDLEGQVKRMLGLLPARL